MALLFSKVTVTAEEKCVEFLVGGIPREYDDLEGWTAFDELIDGIDEETKISVHKWICDKKKRNFTEGDYFVTIYFTIVAICSLVILLFGANSLFEIPETILFSFAHETAFS